MVLVVVEQMEQVWVRPDAAQFEMTHIESGRTVAEERELCRLHQQDGNCVVGTRSLQNLVLDAYI